MVEATSPADEIVRQAAEIGADIIVMGAHRRSFLIDALLGSTSEKVIRKSSVPVLVIQVPEGEQELTSSGI